MEPNRVGSDSVLRHASRDFRPVGGGQRLAVPRVGVLPGRSADEIVAFARMWLPYGGAPAEEIFEQFGMSTRRFREALWASVRATGADLSDQIALVAVYPRV